MKKFFVLSVCVVFLGALFASGAWAERPPIMKVGDVKAGMKGYGLSVFHGTRVERFNVEVLGVLWNFAPRRNVILVRCAEDPAVDYDQNGVIDEGDKFLTKGKVSSGMSGSPVYIKGEDGKDYLIGAIALGWQFSTDALGGVTPIEQMIADMETPLEKPAGAVALPREEGKDDAALAEYRSKLKYLATPLMVSGFNERTFQKFAAAMGKYNIEMMQGGGAGALAADERPVVEPGCTIGVPLIRGDWEIYVYGTLTMIDGDKFVGFGHPFFRTGECRLPITIGSITTTMTSMYSSFKLGGSLGQIGTLLRDRSSSISGVLTEEKDFVKMIPLTIKTAVLKNRESGETEYKTYKMEMLDYEALLPNIVYYCALNAMADDLVGAGDMTAYVQMKFKFEGYDEVTTWDSYVSPYGTDFSYGMAAMLASVIYNPYKPVKLEYVDITIDAVRELRVGIIQKVETDAKEVKPGDKVKLKMKLKGYRKEEWWEEMEVEIPRDIKGDSVTLLIEGGNGANYAALERIDSGGNSVQDIIDNCRNFFKPHSFVVTISYDTVGLRYKGRILTELPPSIRRQFESVAGDDATEMPDAKYFVKECIWVVQGSETVSLKINRKEK